ncbi:MAG: TonB-dependent receptor [Campylobacterota bacterium]|nr:TonB-dependent receptor [Campylobacterota bacterium]
MGKIKFSFVAAIALATSLNAAEDLGKISVESSTIDDNADSQKAQVSNIQVITAKDIETINPKSVSDILNTVPGVTMTLSGTDSLKVHIRGVDNQMYMGERPGVAIVIDGVSVQETTGKINIDLDNIESIKVIKGGASYLYGNDAIAGAVVITTKRQKSGISSSKIEAESGSFGYKKFVASTNQSFETGALQLQGSYTDTDGYWDEAFVTKKSVNSKYQYYIDDTSDITFGADLSKRETGDGNSVSGITEAITDPTSKNSSSYSGYYDSDLTKLFVTYNKDLDDDSNIMVRLHSYEDDKKNKTARTEKDKFEIWDQNGLKSEYRTKLDSFALMAGLDLQKNNTDEIIYDAIDGIDPDDVYNWAGVLQSVGPLNEGDLLEKYKTEESIKAFYTEIKHQTTNDLITTLNLRYDDIEHKYLDDQNNSNNVTPSYDNMSYRLGFNYKLNSNQEIYSSISTGFRAPTVNQISANKSVIADGGYPTPVPSKIDVEKTYNYELGIKGKTEGNLAYNASIFQLDRKDYIGSISGSYIDDDDIGTETFGPYDNVGDMRSRGFELSINSNKSKTFSYDLAYTYLQAKFTKYTISQQTGGLTTWTGADDTFDTNVDLSGNYVPRTPKHMINLAMNYKVNDKLTISPEANYKGSYYADEANKFKMGGYTIFNLKGQYKYSESLEFFARVSNLFDKNYYEFANVSSATEATMENATIRVGEARAYYAGLRYKF